MTGNSDSSGPAKVSDLMRAMEAIAPLELAESWDQVGLHVGSTARELSGPVLLTIDLTRAVLDEAKRLGSSAVVAYHPPIFRPVARLTDEDPGQRLLLHAVEAGIAVFSPHTALDAAEGGVTDWLCEGIAGLSESGKVAADSRALVPSARRSSSKIVTFVPVESAEQVRNAMATAGAGVIGDYRLCSFGVEGTGTFMGGEGTNPAVGEAGRLEEVRELRLEMVCPEPSLALAIETLRRFHPYEEPAIDVVSLRDEPDRNVGAGRRLRLDRPATLREVGERLRGYLDASRVKIAPAEGVAADEPIDVFAVIPGSGGELLKTAAAQGCKAFVTGELKHHDVLAAMHLGVGVVLAGHTNTERGYLPRLATRLAEQLPDVRFVVSEADRDVLEPLV